MNIIKKDYNPAGKGENLMMVKMIKVVITVMGMLLLCSCSDATEPDTLGYVVAIGIDVPTENKQGYDITLQFANPSKISGGSGEEGGKGGGDSIENITVNAPGIYSAVNIANHIVSKTFVLSHTKLIVFSKEVCKNGICQFLESVGRSSDIRPNTYFGMSDGSAREFLEAVDPDTEVNPVRYYSMIFENDNSGFIPQNMSQDFYFYNSSNEKNSVMPICAVSGKNFVPEYSETGYQDKLQNYKAGGIPSEKNEAQVMGAAIFEGDKEVAELGDVETEIYNILSGEYKQSYVSYYYSKSPDIPITVIQRQKRKPKIKVDDSKDIPKIFVEIFIEADFAASTPQIAVEDNLEEFIEEVSNESEMEIRKFLAKTCEIGCDVVGFGSYAKRNFKTIKDFEDYNWKSKYKNAQFDVEVNFALRRTGLIVRSNKW